MNALSFRRNHESLHLQKSQRHTVFAVGLIISCVGEMALIGHALHMPQLYLKDILLGGLDFIVSVLLLSVGNVILLLDKSYNKT